MRASETEIARAIEQATEHVRRYQNSGGMVRLQDRVIVTLAERTVGDCLLTTPRSVVRMCALLMEERLAGKEGEHINKWLNMSVKNLCVNLLTQAMRCDEDWREDQIELLRKHAIDTANIAAFLLEATKDRIAKPVQERAAG